MSTYVTEERVLTRFLKGDNKKHLEPFGGFFGASALKELLGRLQYSQTKPYTEFTNPPTDLDLAETKSSIKSLPAAARLAARLLLCVPGHFRELARRTLNAEQAFEVESLGWLLMAQIQQEMTAIGPIWWIPPAPPFVPSKIITLIKRSNQSALLAARRLEELLLASEQDYQNAYTRWRNGPAGKSWRLEVGIDKSKSGQGTGFPFYPDVVPNGIPKRIQYTVEKQKFDAIWAKVLNHADTIKDDEKRIEYLTGDAPGKFLDSSAPKVVKVGLKGVVLTRDFPIMTRHIAAIRSHITVLKTLSPIFEQLFEAIYELGWNDLIFELDGSFYFRGIKSNPVWNKTQDEKKKAEAIAIGLRRARTLSNHGYGAAIDVNVIENPIGQKVKRIDPRIVKIFEAFGFNYLGCEDYPDPHHFSYSMDTS